MGGVAGGRLAAAVSDAGGLGMIGMGSAGSTSVLEQELRIRRDAARTPAPWGIGLVAWGLLRDPEMFDVALDAGPAAVSVGFGSWDTEPHPTWIARVQAAGAVAVAQVATLADAVRAADAGVDVVVARGLEAGGHGEHLHERDVLLAEVVSAVDVPVLAAGAIDRAETVRSLRDQGAAGVWVGTAFAGCTEALTAAEAKRALFAATGEDTVVSRVQDVALERPWPERYPERILRTAFVDSWQGREAELAGRAEARREFRAAVGASDFGVVPMGAGTGVGSLVAERSAAEVVAALWPAGTMHA